MARLRTIRIRSSAASTPAYLTVFLSLSLTVILSLILTLVEGARIYAIRMQVEVDMQTAMDACLAEYNRVLLDRYDLFYIDTSYGDGVGIGGELDLTSHLEGYLGKNVGRSSWAEFLAGRDLTALSVSDVTIDELRYACDADYESVRQQIYAYMMAGPEGALADNLLELFETTESYEEESWEEAYNESVSDFESACREAEGEDADEEGENERPGRAAGREAIERIRGVLDDIRGVLGQAFLSQVGRENVSTADIYGENILELRDLYTGTAYEAENSHDYGEAGSLLMMQYILEKCSHYGEEMDGSVLQYEIEYILFGHHADEENLEQMTARLVLLRAAADLASIENISQCTAVADVLAGILELFPGIPAGVTRSLILCIWAYAEAIADVRTLYDGGSVPLVKSNANWQTSWGSLFGGSSGGSDGSGLDYTMYLRIFLLAQDMTDPDTVMERLLSVMEVDVAAAQGGIPIRMDYCLDAMAASATFTSGFGYQCTVKHNITYN